MKAAICTVLIATATAGVWAQDSQVTDGRPKITVDGEAVVNVKPDKVVIRFGIETWDVDVTKAKQKNNDIAAKTIAAMKKLGTLEKDIQTDQIAIEPRWNDDPQSRSITGYFVRNSLVVTLPEVGKVEAVMTVALQSGVTHIQGLNFQTTELKKYREQARELALQVAQEKASKMAAVLGQTLGVPLQIYENSGRSSWSYGSGWYGWDSGRSQGMSQVQVQSDRRDSSETIDSVALGKLSIRAYVSVTFEFKK